MEKPQPPADRSRDYDQKRSGAEKTVERLVRHGIDRREAERTVGEALRQHDRSKQESR